MACSALGLAQQGTIAAMGGGPFGPTGGVDTGLGPDPVYSFCGPGADFVTASTTTRTGGACAPSQVCPFVLNVPAVPAGATVLETIISWNYLLNGGGTPTDQILVNGNVVTGARVGVGLDLCWGKEGGASYVALNQTANVVIGGANNISNVCDGPGGGDPAALGEGISIVVVYRMNVGQARAVDVFVGYAENLSGNAESTLQFAQPYLGGPVHFFINALDGQVAGDTFELNGVNAGGTVNGTFAAGDAWIGLAGPCLSDNLYDAADDDVQAFMNAGDTTLHFSTLELAGDCIGHSLLVTSFDGDCVVEPGVDFCFGVGCPCGNDDPFAGCANSTGSGGLLTSAGSTSIDDDDLLMLATNLIPNQTALLFSASMELNGGSGRPFGDGLRCIGVNSIRLSIQFPDLAGNVTYGPGLIALETSPNPGDTRNYQTWYRDPNGPCNSGFNLTNAVRVTYTP